MQNMNNKKEKNTMEKQSSIVIYATEDCSTNLQVKMVNETVWLSTSQMAELFGRDRTVITTKYSERISEI